MARKKRQHQRNTSSDQPVGGSATPIYAAAAQRQPPSTEAEEAVVRLARLIGRQIAYEQFERQQVTRPSIPHLHLDVQEQP